MSSVLFSCSINNAYEIIRRKDELASLYTGTLPSLSTVQIQQTFKRQKPSFSSSTAGSHTRSTSTATIRTSWKPGLLGTVPVKVLLNLVFQHLQKKRRGTSEVLLTSSDSITTPRGMLGVSQMTHPVRQAIGRTLVLKRGKTKTGLEPVRSGCGWFRGESGGSWSGFTTSIMCRFTLLRTVCLHQTSSKSTMNWDRSFTERTSMKSWKVRFLFDLIINEIPESQLTNTLHVKLIAINNALNSF